MYFLKVKQTTKKNEEESSIASTSSKQNKQVVFLLILKALRDTELWNFRWKDLKAQEGDHIGLK